LIAVEFGATTSQLTYLIAGSLLGEAMGCFVVAPLASKYGKRPVWLGCIVVFFICNVWAAVSRSYVSLLLARLFASMAGKL
jgi:predicted MFS family arabinose efflux permease